MTKVALLTLALAISAVSSAPPALRGLQLGGTDGHDASGGDGEKRRLQLGFGNPLNDVKRAAERAAGRAAERAAEEDNGWPDDESLDDIIDGPGASGDDWEKRRLQFDSSGVTMYNFPFGGNRVKRLAELRGTGREPDEDTSGGDGEKRRLRLGISTDPMDSVKDAMREFERAAEQAASRRKGNGLDLDVIKPGDIDRDSDDEWPEDRPLGDGDGPYEIIDDRV
ncbi:unnamed protein product [Vitrella brassicaformis CCMP3155]|uniref:RxLR effector protein n=1 Tax=Vitrella brassicaformis (strain CCMP3155) TaxID=1169540 RepID=A0A0G4GLG2_VITBC|nr:unnamed protein product [Vitrella brassicaformis CCMP3155]|eukprot:CEM30954.1 unnamed protein product [Vitrella brassicaformis CCMP3155]